ncbi:MAG: hypothetical protein JXA60_11445 [Candidatus Coatesbacteria bacterium]|nr:hypothetical protein [Candidatus Coatesbacteria bacterium]
MKKYLKPVVVSERIMERTALKCEDYLYYTKDYEGCTEDYLGRGKEEGTGACAETFS